MNMSDVQLKWLVRGKHTLQQVKASMELATGNKSLPVIPWYPLMTHVSKEAILAGKGGLRTSLHVPAFQHSLRQFLSHAPDYSRTLISSDGIVILSGGRSYLGSAIVTIRLIRERLKSTLPIQLVSLRGEQPFGNLEDMLTKSLNVDLCCLEHL